MAVSNVYVPAEGPKDTNIVFVGEAPGKDEEREKRPFVGYSGQLFRRTLAAVGIDADKVYITNTAKYRPPYNKIKKFFKRGKRPNAKLAEGIWELYRDLAEIQPNVVVPMGGTALWALTGETKITKWRGSITTASPPNKALKAAGAHAPSLEEYAEIISKVAGLKVIPTLHPAYIGRQWHMKQVWQDIDLKRIKTNSAYSEIRLPDRRITVDPSRDVALELADKVKNAPWVGLDIENPGGTLYCVGFAYSPHDAVVFRADAAWKLDLIKELCEHPNGKILQNGWHDLKYLRRDGIEVNGEFFDTMAAHAICYPEYRKGLDFLVSFYLDGEPYYKDEGKGHEVFDPVEYMEYNGKDCYYTLEVGLHLMENELEQHPEWRETYDYIIRQTPIILDIALDGLDINKAVFRAHQQKTIKKRDKHQVVLDERAMEATARFLEHPPKKIKPKDYEKAADLGQKLVANLEKGDAALNVNSTPDMRTFLYTVLGLKVKRDRQTKRPTTAETALKELLSETGDDSLLEIVHVRKARKRLSSYNMNKLAPDGKLHGTINPVGTKSRRWSSGSTIEGWGWNLLTTPSPNPKHSIRDIVIPQPGYILAYYDLSQVEDRIVAYMGDIHQKIYAYENDLDTHKMTAAYLFREEAHKIPYDDPAFRDVLDSIGKKSPERELGKRSNHGYNYEMGPRTFFLYVNKSYDETGIRITYSQAKAFRETHTKVAYPGLQTYWSDVRASLRETRSLTNPFGDRRVFRGRLNDQTFREAYSWIPQSTAPRIVMNGAFEIYEKLPMINIKLQVHDALLLEIPIDAFEEVHPKILEYMTVPISVGGREIIIPVDCEGIGPSWGELQDPERFFEEM